MIGIVDYGMGNRRSVEKALERVGGEPRLTSDRAVLRAADGLVVPGVGAFPEAMRRLRAAALDELVRERAAEGVPVIGLCLGMQLLLERSEEHGGAEGLGLIPGEVRTLDARGLKLPHIGWNEVRWARRSPLVEGLPDPATFYHVHTFVPYPADREDALVSNRGGLMGVFRSTDRGAGWSLLPAQGAPPSPTAFMRAQPASGSLIG